MAFMEDNKSSLSLSPDSMVKPQSSGGDEILAMPDAASTEAAKNENLKWGSVISFVKHKYERAKNKRKWDETRWLMAYNNYRGLYDNEVVFREDEQSRAFIKITKTKVLAAAAQIQDILFAANKFPIGIEPSPVPEGVAEMVHFDPKAPEGKTPSSTVVRPDILKALGPLKDQLEPIKDKLKEGPGKTPTSQTFEPALEAAKGMEKLIHDQLQVWLILRVVFFVQVHSVHTGPGLPFHGHKGVLELL